MDATRKIRETGYTVDQPGADDTPAASRRMQVTTDWQCVKVAARQFDNTLKQKDFGATVKHWLCFAHEGGKRWHPKERESRGRNSNLRHPQCV
ncbi:uncharacterized protein V6R79_007187 [Siganus canaliculatus]